MREETQLDSFESFDSGMSFFSWRKFLLLLVACGAIAALFIHNGQRQGARKVQLVNGVSVSYTVEIDGTKHDLPRHSHTEIKLAEGDHTVVIVAINDLSGTPQNALDLRQAARAKHVAAASPGGTTVKINSSFIQRNFKSETIILNPDASAILIESDVVYGNLVGKPDQVHKTSVLHMIGGIDDVFKDSPNSVKTNSTSRGEIRRRLDLLRVDDLASYPAYLSTGLKGNDEQQMFRRQLAMAGDDTYLRQEASDVLKDDEIAQLTGHDVPRPQEPSPIPQRPERIAIERSPVQSAETEVEAPLPSEPTPVQQWANFDRSLLDDIIDAAMDDPKASIETGAIFSALGSLGEENDVPSALQAQYLVMDQITATVEALRDLDLPDDLKLPMVLVIGQANARQSRSDERLASWIVADELIDTMDHVDPRYVTFLESRKRD